MEPSNALANGETSKTRWPRPWFSSTLKAVWHIQASEVQCMYFASVDKPDAAFKLTRNVDTRLGDCYVECPVKLSER